MIVSPALACASAPAIVAQVDVVESQMLLSWPPLET
jgi:hypothetical protein